MREVTRFEVVTAGAKWNVTEKGIGRLSTYLTKDAAEAAAREMAGIHTPSELVIRRADGTVESEQTYAAPPKVAAARHAVPERRAPGGSTLKGRSGRY
jgi:hypothetical protein